MGFFNNWNFGRGWNWGGGSNGSGSGSNEPDNQGPVLDEELIDQTAVGGEDFEFRIPSDAFSDPDGDDLDLTYAAEMADGGTLPSWLTFDPDTHKFTGSPDDADAGVYMIRVTVTDEDGAEVSDVFVITVEEHPTGNPGEDFFGSITGDTMFGTDGDDELRGLSGDDSIYGAKGNDKLFGFTGDDVLMGGEGDDEMVGDFGDDTYYGGDGEDTAVIYGRARDFDLSWDRDNRVWILEDKRMFGTGTDTLGEFVEYIRFWDTTVELTPPNEAPDAEDVAADANEDGPTIVVTADFFDWDIPHGDTHTFEVDDSATAGSVTNNGDGTFTYDPAGQFESLAEGETAIDTFTYTVIDQHGERDTATATVTITGQNDAPVALAITGETDEDGPAITLAADFSDVDASDTHTFSVDDSATLGSVVDNGDGTFTYDPAGAFDHLGEGETATDTFTYTVDDGNGGTDTKSVTVTITGENDPPVAVDDDLTPAGPVAGAANIGYYDLFLGEGNDTQKASILAGGHIAVDIQDLSAAELADLDVLVIQNPNNSGYPSEFLNQLAVIQDAVSDGLVLIIHDRFVDDAETILPGGGAFDIVRDFTDDEDLEFLDDGHPVALGLNDDSLDGGTSSSHGFAIEGTLPADADLILSTSDSSEIVTFQYDWGAGAVIYSSIPLDFYLAGFGPAATQANMEVYAANIIDWAAADLTNGEGVEANEDAVALIDTALLLANDSDPDNDPLEVVSVSATSMLGALITLNGDGTISYDPTAAAGLQALSDGETTTDTFEYTIADPDGETSTATVTITIEGRNDAPVALAIAGETDEDGPSITLTADFTDVDASDTHTFSVDDSATMGSVVDNGDGTFTYDPNGAFEYLSEGDTATDTFTYTVDDGNGGTDTKTATVTITGQNDGPVALDFEKTVTEDASSVGIAYQFHDPDASGGHTTSFDLSEVGGTYSFTAPGVITWIPGGIYDYLAEGETFTGNMYFTVTDDHGASDVGVGEINVTGVNDAVVIENADLVGEVSEADNDSQDEVDNVTHTASGVIAFSDIDLSDTHSVSIVPQGGGYLGDLTQVLSDSTGTGAGDVAWTFAVSDADLDHLEDGETLTQSYDVTISDGFTSETRTVVVTLNGAGDNTPPVAVDDSAAGDEDSVATIDAATLLANDTDGESDPLTVVSVSGASTLGAVVTLTGTDISYDPTSVAVLQALAVGETAIDTFTYTIEDPDGETSIATVTITIEGRNDGPVAVGYLVAAEEDGPAITSIPGAGFADIDTTDALTVVFDGSSTTGVVTDNGDETFSFDPDGQFEHLDDGEVEYTSVDYTVTDQHGASDTGGVTIQVNGANDAPEAQDDADTTQEEHDIVLDLLANDTDVDDEPLTVVSVAGQALAAPGDTANVSDGVVTLNADGTVTLTPDVHFFGDITFDYEVSDGDLTDTASVTVTVTDLNDRPTGSATPLADGVEDTPVVLDSADLLLNFFDYDNDPLFVESMTADHGDVVDNGDGTFTITPEENYNGPLTISYFVTDGRGGALPVTQTMNLVPVNDAPVIPDVIIATNEDTPIYGQVAADDPEGDVSTFALDQGPEHGALTFAADGSWTYTPEDGFNGADSFTFTADDGNGGVSTGTALIDVASTSGQVRYVYDSRNIVSDDIAGNYYPDVTALADGGHLVVWQASSASNEDSDNYGVYARRYDVDGEPVGDAFLVNTTTTSYQRFASAAGLEDGGLVIVWESYDSSTGQDIVLQRYDDNGDPVGGEVVVNETKTNDQRTPEVTALSGGGYAVVWSSYDASGASGLDGYARIYNADGTPASGEFIINSETTSTQEVYSVYSQTITQLGNGTIVVVFIDSSGLDGSSAGIFASLFEADGTPIEQDIQVNTTTDGYQHFGSVGELEDGGFVITWSDNSSADGNGYGVFAQRFDENGDKVGDEFQVNSYTNSTQYLSEVQGLPDGGYFIIWQSYGVVGNNRYEIVGQRYDANGDPIGGEVLVGSEAGYVYDHNDTPSMDVREDGSIAIVWRSSTGSVIEQAIISDFETDTIPVGSLDEGEIDVSSPIVNNYGQPDVAALSGGGHVVVWHAIYNYDFDNSGYGVFAHIYDENGDSVGAPFLVNTTTSQNQIHADVAATTDGGFVVTWMSYQQDGSNYGVYAQRFDANGDTIDGEVLVNQTTANWQAYPSITALDDGGYAVVWEGHVNNSNYRDVYLRIFNADGTARTGELVVNATTNSYQYTYGYVADNVTQLADGRIALVFADASGQDGSGNGVYLRLFDTDGVALTGDILVNTTTDGTQYFGSIGALKDGGFVVTWRDDTADGSGTGIFAQRYDDNGDAVDGEFQVNTFTLGAQDQPKILGLDDGGFIIAWHSLGADGDGGYDIVAQRYAANGDVVGDEVLVSGDADDHFWDYWHETEVDMTQRDDGAIIFVWRDQRSNNIIEQKIVTDFDAQTSPIDPQAQDELVSTTTTGNYNRPEAAALPDGGHVVVWHASSDFNGDDDSSEGVYLARYDADGVMIGDPELVNTTKSNSQFVPGVSVFTDGGFVVTWTSQNQDGSGNGIYAQRYDSEGDKIGGEIQINQTTSNNQRESNITTLPDGGFAVTWKSYSGNPDYDDVYARIFNADGTARTGEFVVNSVTAGYQYTDAYVTQSITSLDDGKIVVAFYDGSARDGSSSGVFMRIYEADGTPVGGDVQVNTYTNSSQYAASVSALADGGFIIVWESYYQDGSGDGIYAQRYDEDGATVGDEFRVNSYTQDYQERAAVTGLSDGGFIITWSSRYAEDNTASIHGQRFDANGDMVGEEFVVQSAFGWNEYESSVIEREDGAIVVVWRNGSTNEVQQKIITDFDAAGAQGAKTLEGGDNNDSLMGGDSADSIDGGHNDDLIIGGLGGDDLAGGPGQDQFLYLGVDQGGDTITDFTSGEDELVFAADGFTGLVAGDAVTLLQGAGVAASGSGPQFLFDTDTSTLYFDADGAGGEDAVEIAVLTGVSSLTEDDFSIV